MSQSDCPMCAPQVFFNTRPIPYCYPIDTLNRPEVCRELAHGRMCPPFAIREPHNHPPPPGERGNIPHRRPPRQHEGFAREGFGREGTGQVRGAAACLTCPGNLGPWNMRRYATMWALLKSIPDGYGPWGYGYDYGAPFPQSRCNKDNFFAIPQWRDFPLPPSCGPIAGQVGQAITTTRPSTGDILSPEQQLDIAWRAVQEAQAAIANDQANIDRFAAELAAARQANDQGAIASAAGNQQRWTTQLAADQRLFAQALATYLRLRAEMGEPMPIFSPAPSDGGQEQPGGDTSTKESSGGVSKGAAIGIALLAAAAAGAAGYAVSRARSR